MFNPRQRRYLGNKSSLLEFINKSIKSLNVKYESFADLFAGTGVVGFDQLLQGKKVIMNDFLYSNYIVYEAFAGQGSFSITKLEQMVSKWNEMDKNLIPANYFDTKFGNKYFHIDDAKLLGYARDEIENLKETKKINIREYYILLASLVFSMDRVALTVGHYDAYRENAAVRSELVIKLIEPYKISAEIYNVDTNVIARDIAADVVYLDPPYNSRQYGDAYHLLENYCRWEKPETFGKAEKMLRHEIKSEYSMKNAIISFETLINSLNTKLIVVSYNDTGSGKDANSRSAAKMSDKDILRILKRRGEVKIFEQKYGAFNTGTTKRKEVVERLFVCKVKSKPIYEQNLKSPLNYSGGKFGIIEDLKNLFPPMEQIQNFYDVFAGALNVGINSGCTSVVATEKDVDVVSLLNYIKETPTSELIRNIEQDIKKFNLSNSSVYSYKEYGVKSNDGLAQINKNAFIKMRDSYNKNKKTRTLLTLVVYSFNNLIRFNGKNEFNSPVGKRDFNNSMRANLISFSERLKDIVIEISANDFAINQPTINDFVFLDPPYWITNAVYNYSKWTEDDEIRLYEYLNYLNENNIPFMLTNAIKNGERVNHHLQNFLEANNNLQIIDSRNHFRNSSYNKKDENKVKEIIVINYNLG